MNKARIRVQGLAAQVYWEKPVGFDKTAVVVPGLPYETTQEPITKILTDHGYGVIQPQYMGSYDSDGQFSPQGCVQTLFKLEDILKTSSELYDIRGERVFRIGNSIDLIAAHSFGTYVAMAAILRGLQVPTAIMLSPMFEFGAKRDAVGLKVDMEKHVRHFSTALPLTLRLQSVDVWHNFFVTDEKYHPEPDMTACTRQTRLLAVCGDSDPSLNVSASKTYVKNFALTYPKCLSMFGYEIVRGGTHSVSSLLTSKVCRIIKKLAAKKD